MFECDVKLSADGVPFLMHDATLERTTTGRGAAATCRGASSSRLDAGGWHAAPSPASRCRRWRPSPASAWPTATRSTSRSSRRRAATPRPAASSPPRRRGSGPSADALPPLLSSFQPDALAAARDAAPALPRALLLDALRDGWLDEPGARARLQRGTSSARRTRLIDAAVDPAGCTAPACGSPPTPSTTPAEPAGPAAGALGDLTPAESTAAPQACGPRCPARAATAAAGAAQLR